MNERNKEINILKGEASKQISQIRESITKFLDKETGTLGERIRTLFTEQGHSFLTGYNDSIHINRCWYGYRCFDRSFTRWS